MPRDRRVRSSVRTSRRPALSDLSHRLLEAAADRIDASSGGR